MPTTQSHHARLAGARVVVMTKESTMINLDQPDELNRIVLDFLDAINQSPNQ